MCVLKVLFEGSMSQFFYLGLSFCAGTLAVAVIITPARGRAPCLL